MYDSINNDLTIDNKNEDVVTTKTAHTCTHTNTREIVLNWHIKVEPLEQLLPFEQIFIRSFEEGP